MKKLLLLLIIIPMIGFSQQRVSIEKLTDSSGIMYDLSFKVEKPLFKGVRYGDELFTGIAYYNSLSLDERADNNQLIAEYNYINGVLHGSKTWFESGQLKNEFKGFGDGDITEMSFKTWYENGNLQAEGNISKEGKKGSGTGWYENGQLKEKVIFEDGVVIKIACWDFNGGSIDCSQEEYDLEGESEAANDYIEDESPDKSLEFEGHYKKEKLSNLLFFIILLSLF
jgi:antitoxin component YwqK of YwqJK toxin-antitoxin module